MEKINIVHRDIKMDNFIVRKYDLGFIVQIADFSESTHVLKEKSLTIRGNRSHLSPEFIYALLKN